MTYLNTSGLMVDKKKLYKHLLALTEERIINLKIILQEAQDAANSETKSSAGDKHETGRAMAQLETEKINNQLGEVYQLKATLNKINPELRHESIGLGSLVITNNGNFYISASLGKIEIDDSVYYAISTSSPIGKILVTKKEKETFSFNNRSYVIKNVN